MWMQRAEEPSRWGGADPWRGSYRGGRFLAGGAGEGLPAEGAAWGGGGQRRAGSSESSGTETVVCA